jgi:hypothetical protein
MKVIPGMRNFISTLNAISATFAIDAALNPHKIGDLYAFVVYVFNPDSGDYNIDIASLQGYAGGTRSRIGDSDIMIKIAMYPTMKRPPLPVCSISIIGTEFTMTALRKVNSRTLSSSISTNGNDRPRLFAAAICKLLRLEHSSWNTIRSSEATQ